MIFTATIQSLGALLDSKTNISDSGVVPVCFSNTRQNEKNL